MKQKEELVERVSYGLDINDLREYRRAFASSGGKAFVAKYGKNKMKELSKLGVEARKRNKAKLV